MNAHAQLARARAARRAKLQATYAERFWARVDRKGPRDCWEWTGHASKSGYCHVRKDSKVMLAHRVALALTDGDWDNALDVLHTCDNPRCCNPAHLWRGTQLDNMRDMYNKGRGPRRYRGSTNKNAKLSEPDIMRIRTSEKRNIDLASEYNVAKTTISAIKKRRSWRHVS